MVLIKEYFRNGVVMYNYIKGKITETAENLLVVEANGVGYELNVSSFTLSELSQKEGEVKVYSYLSVREDDMSLFGFATKREKAMFIKLIGISGVGPKLAITLLGGLSVEQLASAVVCGDVKLLSKIKGVGKKTAERIVLELKDKVDTDYAEDVAVSTQGATILTATPNEEAVLALMTLGYSRMEASTAVARVQSDGMTLEEIIFNALKNA